MHRTTKLTHTPHLTTCFSHPSCSHRLALTMAPLMSYAIQDMSTYYALMQHSNHYLHRIGHTHCFMQRPPCLATEVHSSKLQVFFFNPCLTSSGKCLRHLPFSFPPLTALLLHPSTVQVGMARFLLYFPSPQLIHNPALVASWVQPSVVH